jgi:hypothetical protein
MFLGYDPEYDSAAARTKGVVSGDNQASLHLTDVLFL